MAAAVAAVDSMDDAFETEPWTESASESPADAAVEAAVEVTAEAAPEATAAVTTAATAAAKAAAAETVPEATAEPVVTELRAEAESASEAPMAKTEFEAGPVAAEAAPTTPIKRADARAAIEWPANDRLVSAKAPKTVGGTESGDLEALRRPLLAATSPEATAAAQPAVEARHEASATPAAQPEGVDWDLSEANAEREALREAVAIVMDAGAGLETAPERTEANGTDGPVVSAPVPTESHASEPPTTEPQTPPAEAPPGANTPAKASAVQEPPPRKKGLFRRIRG
jgi:hypothetical protein